MGDLIDRAALLECIDAKFFATNPSGEEQLGYLGSRAIIRTAPAVDAVELPCKIGDRVWAIRSYKGIKHPQEGIVSEMFFTDDMQLMTVVKNVARGTWGKTVFSSYKEAENAIEERKET